MIEIIASLSIGSIIGYGICAALTAGKVADSEASADRQCEEFLRQLGATCRAEAAHSRCADALQTVRGKMEAIKALVDTPRTIRKGDVRRILGDGE